MWKTGGIPFDQVFLKIKYFNTGKSTALLLAKRQKLLIVLPFISPIGMVWAVKLMNLPLWICILWLSCLLKGELVMKPALQQTSDDTSLFCPLWLEFIGMSRTRGISVPLVQSRQCVQKLFAGR